jgi:hypothetical protein
MRPQCQSNQPQQGQQEYSRDYDEIDPEQKECDWAFHPEKDADYSSIDDSYDLK